MSCSFPSSRGAVRIRGGKMTDKNPEQRLNIKFCVKIGKSADSPMLMMNML
jgi:hypothetical protein